MHDLSTLDQDRWGDPFPLSPLLTIPPLELAQLWAELVESWHGVNSYGGDTAELYPYRFQRYNPAAHRGDSEPANAAMQDVERLACLCLAALLQEFRRRYPCEVVRTKETGDVPF